MTPTSSTPSARRSAWASPSEPWTTQTHKQDACVCVLRVRCLGPVERRGHIHIQVGRGGVGVIMCERNKCVRLRNGHALREWRSDGKAPKLYIDRKISSFVSRRRMHLNEVVRPTRGGEGRNRAQADPCSVFRPPPPPLSSGRKRPPPPFLLSRPCSRRPSPSFLESWLAARSLCLGSALSGHSHLLLVGLVLLLGGGGVLLGDLLNGNEAEVVKNA